MTIEEITKRIAEPEKLVSPEEVNLLKFYVSSWITDKEEELNEQNYQVAIKRRELLIEHKSVAKADLYLELEPRYLEREKTKLLIKDLRSIRSNLRDRYDVLVNKYKF
jgi:hypothetical protein